METIGTFFSIIIPTFNRAQLIFSTVKSILSQENTSIEVIIIDDGSVDNTRHLIEGLNDERVKYIKTQNRERGAARNTGLQFANGTYVNYFDSDDILAPCLFDLQQFIINTNLPNVVYGSIENVTEEDNAIEIVNPAYSNFRKSLLYNNFLACGSVFIKREIALQFIFSEDRSLSGTEDWELWLRLYSAHDFVKFPKVICRQRQHILRSLHKVPLERVVERETAFINHIEKHQTILSRKFSSAELELLIADRYTLIALAECESSKNKSFNNLLRSLNRTLAVIRRKRFWAVLKKLILD